MEFSQFHLDIFKRPRFRERKIRRLWIAPRGNAKSTFETLIYPIHDACYATEAFILFVSSTELLANKKLKDIRAEVLSNSLLQDWYGIHFKTKKVGDSEFTVYSHAGETHFAAAGKGSQVRGIRYRQHRPSKIIFDDFETSEEVANEALRKKTEAIYHEEFGKTGNENTNIVFVGTVLHKDALAPTLLKNAAYDGNLYRAVISWSAREDLWEQWRKIYRDLENPDRLNKARAFYEMNRDEMLRGTKVLWPEKKDYYGLMVEMEEIGKRAFFKEMQNDPMSADQVIFENIHWYREEEKGLRLRSNNSLVPWELLRTNAGGSLDPSTGAKKAQKGALGDFTCMLAGYHGPGNRIFVHWDYTKKVAPTKYIEAIFDAHERFNFMKFAAETNLYRNLLMPNIFAEKKRREEKSGKKITIPFYDVIQTENKHERIHRLEPKVNHGIIVFNEALSTDFKRMLEDYPHHPHDDGPDALEILYNTFMGVYRVAGLSLESMSV